MKIIAICAAASLALTGMIASTASAQMGPPPGPGPGGPPPPPPGGPGWHGHGYRWHHRECRYVWRHHHRVRRCW